MKIYFIRHGESTANVDLIWGGNYPLTENGIRQASETDPPEVSLILCSNLKRAIHTAELIFPGRDLVFDSTFREISFGAMDDTPIIEDSPTLNSFANEPWNIQNSIKGADDCFERACESLKKIIKYADELEKDDPDGDIALVAHRALMRSMISIIRHQDVHHMMGYDIDNCAVFEIDMEDIRSAISIIDSKS